MRITIDVRRWAGRLMAAALWVLLCLDGLRVCGDSGWEDFAVGIAASLIVTTVYKPWAQRLTSPGA